MSPIKEFTTAVAQAEKAEGAEDEGIEFDVDGVMCKCYHPGDGQLAYLMASMGRHTSTQERVAGVVNFFVAVLDADSQQYVIGRLLDRGDPFGITEVQQIMEWMVEEWAGRPTKSPSGSTPSRQRGGRKSTQPTPALT